MHRSIQEEIVGILWAILATQATNGFVFWPAVFMACVSLFAAIRFAVIAARKETQNAPS